MLEHDLRIAKMLARLLDDEFSILGFRFGLDPIIGLLPGGGDAIGLLVSLYIVGIGIKHRLPNDLIFRMIIHCLLDFGIGLIPIIGDIGDFVFKSNQLNVALLESFHEQSKYKHE